MLMKSFEPIYKELEELFIHNLPDYIEKINRNYNDGILIKKFENRTLDEDCIKKPCFKFSIEDSEYSEKDRIIENTVFKISLELILQQESKLPPAEPVALIRHKWSATSCGKPLRNASHRDF